MNVSFEINDEMTAYVRKQAVARDMTTLPVVALVKIFEYGFQRINNDAGAVGKDESTTDALAKADKKWNALVSGDIRVTRASSGDPVTAEARKIAGVVVKAAWVKKYGKAPGKEDQDEFKNLVNDYATKTDVREKAIANLESVEGLSIEL